MWSGYGVGAVPRRGGRVWLPKIRNNSGRQDPRCGSESGLSFVMVSSSKYNTLVQCTGSVMVELGCTARSRVFREGVVVRFPMPWPCRSIDASQPAVWAGLGPGPGACPAGALQ